MSLQRSLSDSSSFSYGTPTSGEDEEKDNLPSPAPKQGEATHDTPPREVVPTKPSAVHNLLHPADGGSTMTKEVFSASLANLARQTPALTGRDTEDSHSRQEEGSGEGKWATAGLPLSSAMKRILSSRSLDLLPTSPAGFTERVYHELLQVKKDIAALQQEKRQLRTAKRRMEKEVNHQEVRFGRLLRVHGCLEQGVKHRSASRDPSTARKREKKITAACGTLILSEEARKKALKKRVEALGVEVKHIDDLLRVKREDPVLRHVVSLGESVEDLRCKLNSLREAVKSCASQDVQRRVGEELEEVLSDTRRTEETTERIRAEHRELHLKHRRARGEVASAQQRYDSQCEVRDRVILRVEEARMASQALKQQQPAEEEALTVKMQELDENLREKNFLLSSAKLKGEEEVATLRRILQRLTDEVDAMQRNCDAEKGCGGEIVRKVDEVRELLAAQAREWPGEDDEAIERLEAHHKALLEHEEREYTAKMRELEQEKEMLLERKQTALRSIEQAIQTHRDRITTERKAAEHRNASLLQQLQGT